MSSRLRTLTVALLALLAVLALSACGDSHTKVTGGTYAGESGANAPYLDVGPLVYEVQLSRQLNPLDTEDAAYLQGINAAERKLAPGEEWFGVFIQVYNNNSIPITASSSLTISDTQGNIYTPLAAEPTNPFVYHAGPVPAKGRLPVPDSVASTAPSQGALLLYKIQIASLDNRPLKLRIANPTNTGETASAELDV
ncbi:MAG: hypothetical protein QOI03_1471 [Solirubrobacteraceae bacterium]|jgi:hypothetical protein|nr:hypothetical protein [Solirubrobacteraceae bacterium]